MSLSTRETRLPARGLALRSTVRRDGTLLLGLEQVKVPEPGENEVLVRVEAAPINPSDLGLLLGGADLATARQADAGDAPSISARVPEPSLAGLTARLDKALPVGNEGAGVVIAAGESAAAQALLGKTVALMAGGMYAQYRCVPASEALLLPAGVSPAEGASCFVNPLTALGMVETMKLENHSALVHTAAASNLGQMLNRICQQDGIELVNIVRRKEQEGILRDIGAGHVCNSSADDFMENLTDSLSETGATLAFDAVGGGELASQILRCMETAQTRQAKGYSIYGSQVHKQVYIYGGLGAGNTVLSRNYGLAWGVGGWLLPNFLQRIGPQATREMKARIAAEISTTFASEYSREITLGEALSMDVLKQYAKMATGEKFLVTPNSD